MNALLRALTDSRGIENIEQALGMPDITSDAMRRAIDGWFDAWFSRVPPDEEDPCQRIPYAVVNKLGKAVFAEYDSSLQNTGTPKLQYLDRARQAFDAKKRELLQWCMVGGETWAKPVFAPDGLTWQVIRRDAVLILGRAPDGRVTDLACCEKSVVADHEPYQGRQYSDAEYEKLNNSLQRRIGHLNCGHTASPIILGVNAPQYTEEQLRELADANERGVTYNGQHYTLYEAGQEQSRLENAVRTCKRHILMNRETGDAKNLKNNQIRLRVLQSEYGKFCKATGLPTRTERLQTAGFGRSEANKAVWEYKKSSGTKASDLGGQALHTVTDEAIQAVPKPFFRGLSNKANTAAQGYARDLLTKVKDLPLGTEATVSFTEDGQCSWEVGDLKEMRVKVKDLQVPYYSLHNHASNGILSPEDIFQLAKHDNMKGIGAVGHDGALHTCEKVFGYKKENFNRWMDGLLEKYPLYQSQDANKVETALKQRIDLANELRQDGDKHGLRFSG